MWTAIVVIVIVTMVASVMMKRYEALGRSDRRSQHGDDTALAARSEAEQRELAELRERVKVLERIATDANTTEALTTRRVADEIESLRDKHHS